MKPKRFAAVCLAAALMLTAGCGTQETEEEEQDLSTPVEVSEASTAPMYAEYTLTGTVAAVSEVQVFPMLAGQVRTLSVKAGDTVSKGQVLFTVDTSNVTSTLGSLQQSYSSTKAATDRAIESAQIGVQQAQTAVENARALYEVGAAAAQDVTTAEQGLAQAQAGLAQAQAQQSASLAQLQASIDQINAQAELGTVTAPSAGRVTAVNLVLGGMASSAQPAVVIAANGEIEVKVSVAEDVFVGLSEGDRADVVISSMSDEPMQGTIRELPAAANTATSLYDLSVSLPKDAAPPIGAFASVTFFTNRREDAISVPSEAILTDSVGQYLFIVDSQTGTAVRIDVETGLVNDERTEIVSGLNVGDQVVVKGQSYLTDGAEVRVVSGADDAAADDGQNSVAADSEPDDAAAGGEG